MPKKKNQYEIIEALPNVSMAKLSNHDFIDRTQQQKTFFFFEKIEQPLSMTSTNNHVIYSYWPKYHKNRFQITCTKF